MSLGCSAMVHKIEEENNPVHYFIYLEGENITCKLNSLPAGWAKSHSRHRI